jgi:hypothetical protein
VSSREGATTPVTPDPSPTKADAVIIPVELILSKSYGIVLVIPLVVTFVNLSSAIREFLQIKQV